MLGPGARRHRLARTLNSAYAEGLLSERTLAHRLDVLFDGVLIDPSGLVGDLTARASHPARWRGIVSSLTVRPRRAGRGVGAAAREPGVLLALDWSGDCEELLIGRHPDCDVVLADDTVSRRHVQLIFRDGGWIVRDLESTNGTRLNGQHVGRCRLRPGDQLRLGRQLLRVD